MAHMLSGALYRNVRDWGITVEQVVLVDGLVLGLAAMVFLYALARTAGGSPFFSALAVSVSFLANSYEGVDRLWVLSQQGASWDAVRFLNIDAVTRWFYEGMPVDGLQRMLLYQPHHLTGYMLCLSALWLVGRAEDVTETSVALWAGILLGLGFLFSTFTAIIVGVAIGVLFAIRLIARGALRPRFPTTSLMLRSTSRSTPAGPVSTWRALVAAPTRARIATTSTSTIASGARSRRSALSSACVTSATVWRPGYLFRGRRLLHQRQALSRHHRSSLRYRRDVAGSGLRHREHRQDGHGFSRDARAQRLPAVHDRDRERLPEHAQADAQRGFGREYRGNFEKLARFNFVIDGSFFSNFPGETLEDIKLTLALIEKLHEVNPNFRNSPVYHYTPYPGTPMFEQAVSAGFTAPDNLKDWSSFNFEGQGFVQVGGQEGSSTSVSTWPRSSTTASMTSTRCPGGRAWAPSCIVRSRRSASSTSTSTICRRCWSRATSKGV